MRGLRRLATAILVSALVAACGLGPVDTGHRPSLGAVDSTRVLLELEQLWQPTDPAAGAYGYVDNLEATPSLYATAWHLQVAADVHAPLPELSRDETAAWLVDAMNGGRPSPGLNRMEAVQLSIQGLRGLGRAVPARAGGALDELRQGDLYAWEKGGAPSWPATAVAVQALAAAGVTPGAGLAAAVRAALPATTATAATPDAWLNQLLPQWAAADEVLSPAERTALRPPLAASLRKLHDVAMGAPLSEVTIFVMAQVVTIARANGIAGLDFPESAWRPLVTPAGFLAAAAGDPSPSMVNTHYAGVLGFRPPPVLADYLRYSAAPRGWRMDVGPPDVKASFYALEVSRALGKRDHEPALRGQAGTWLTESADALAHPDGRPSFEGVYFAVLLARALGLAPPAALTAALAVLTEDRQAELPAGALPSLARVAAALGYRPGPRFEARLRALLPTLDLGRMADVGAAHDIAALLDDAPTLGRVGSAATRLGSPTRYLTRQGAPSTDLRSTAIGTLVTGGHLPPPRAVEAVFADSRGFWLLPVSETVGNTVDMETLYLGLWLSGRAPAAGGIV